MFPSKSESWMRNIVFKKIPWLIVWAVIDRMSYHHLYFSSNLRHHLLFFKKGFSRFPVPQSSSFLVIFSDIRFLFVPLDKLNRFFILKKGRTLWRGRQVQRERERDGRHKTSWFDFNLSIKWIWWDQNLTRKEVIEFGISSNEGMSYNLKKLKFCYSSWFHALRNRMDWQPDQLSMITLTT